MRRRIDYEKLREEMDREADWPVISSALRFVSRPGYAVRSLLAGDPVAAAKNLGQMALDLPTGGFLDRRLSLANLAGVEGGDLTSRHDRVGGIDLLRRWGAPVPQTAGGQFLAGLTLDFATDPLTPLTFGGGGVTKAALTGLGKAVTAERLAAGLMSTAKGRALLQGVPMAERAATLERMFGSLDNLSAEAAEGLAARLVKEGLSVDPSALRVGEKAIVGNFWRKAYGATLPGAAQKLAKRVAPETEQKVTGALREAFDWGTKNLYDKRMVSANQDPRLSRWQLEGEQLRGVTRVEWQNDLAPKVAKLASPEVRNLIGQRLHEAEDLFNVQAWGKSKAQRDQITSELMAGVTKDLDENAIQALKLERAAYAKARDQLREEGVWAKAGTPVWDADHAANVAELTAARTAALRNAEGLQAAAASGDKAAIKAFKDATKAREAAERELLDYQTAVRALTDADGPKSLKEAEEKLGSAMAALTRRGITMTADNPFHLPRQLTDEAAALMPKGQGLWEGGIRPGVKTALLRKRDYQTMDEWLAAVQKAGRAEGASDESLAEVAAEALKLPEKIVETDIALLAARYGDKLGTSLGRQRLLNQAKKAGLDLKQGSPADLYIKAQWEIPGRKSAVQKILNEFNKRFKPWQTVVWPSYHVRNLLSAIFQTALDPDLSVLDGFRAAWNTFKNAPALNSTKSLGNSPDEVLAIMRATSGDMEAYRALLPGTIAGRPAKEVLDTALGMVTSKGGGEADLFESLAEQLKIGLPSTAKQPEGLVATNLGRMQKFQEWAYSVAAHAENSMRVQAYLNLVGKGTEPVEAARRVNKIFVDYAVQSKADRALRDLFPFVRFPLAITPPTVEAFIRRPGGLVPQLFRQAQTQAEGRPDEEQVGLPGYVRNGFRIPLGGGDYVASLGLPQEAASQFLGAVPTPGRGFTGSRQFAAGLAPPARLLAEGVSGVNFFTGRGFGEDRRAHGAAGLIPSGLFRAIPGARTFEGQDGREIRELPGWFNELVRLLPTSRFTSQVDALAKEDATVLDKAVRLVTGVSRVTADERRGAARAMAGYFEKLRQQGRVGELRSHWARVAEGEEIPEGLRAALEAESALRSKNKRK